ncbi:hypothetical protein [Thalassobellus suaedae]|uniref:Uncharacterized protein n=1 Tax=Thalassobellus suaedae TaxID=3074124 RepID=A0ABY9XVZ1_9FLAO|nr:hypothetical protein RHP51_04820 [Flavobacteriaceae bacterium HL-DH14]
MSGGKGAAYQRLRPLQGDITTDLLNAEDQEFKHREEQRIIADRRAKAAADKNKKAQEGLSRAKALKLYDTGSGSLNESLAEAITIATNEYPEIFKILDDETGKYSQGEKIKAKLKYDNILNLPENLKLMTNSVMGEYQQYQQGVANGSLFKNEAYESKFQDGFKGVSLSIDDNGLPVSIFRNSAKDSNGDGIIDANDVETLDSLNDAYSRPQHQKKFNYDGLVTKHVDKLKSAKTDNVNGFTTTTNTGVEIDLLEQSVNRVLYDAYGKPTDIMKSFLKERGLDENKPEDLKTIENDYKNDIYIRTERGKKIDRNESAIVANKKLNQKNQEDTNKSTIGETVTPTKQTYSIYHGNINTKVVNSVNLNGKAVIPALKTEKGEFLTNLKPHNITRDKFGRMIVEGSYQINKSSKYTSEELLDFRTKSDNGDEEAELKLKEYSKGSENKRKDVTISKEAETEIAGALGMTVEELDKSIYKNTEDAKDKQEVDEYGVPIN